MTRRLNLTNRNSNEIYSLIYPKNLLAFMKYDFTVFMERSTDLCRLYMKTGTYKQEEVIEIRNSISNCHRFVEQNIRGAFDKLVIDCWIEYICRLNEIGVVTLWNNFIPCRTDFEKAIFARLSEYRYNHAINQWVNILKIQEYAKTKTEFIFGNDLKNLSEAVIRTNYFDLMFNVAANELGYDVTETADNKLYSLGRTPNSPFIMSSVSREIVRSMFSDLKYFEEVKTKPKKGEFIADQTAMDAFSAIKAFIPTENDLALGTMLKSMNDVPQKVYMPTGFKAVVDLEIDAILDSEAVLQRCGRCREFFLRHEDYDYDYCDKISREGRSCLEIMNSNGVETTRKKEKTIDSGLLTIRCDQLYREMSERVNVDITQRDFSDWYKYLMLIRDNVLSGAATVDDFDNFVEYSRSIAFLGKVKPDFDKENNFTPIEPKQGKNLSKKSMLKPQFDTQGREVKPFIFEKIDRSVINEQGEEYTEAIFNNIMSKRRANVETPPPPPSHYRQMPPPIKVIRGTTQQTLSPVHENSFHPESITIPYGNKESQSVRKPENYNLEIERFDSSNREEDIKIYNVTENRPVEEFVKVFQPETKKGKKDKEIQKPLERVNRVTPFYKETEEKPEFKLDDFLLKSSEAAERDFAASVEKTNFENKEIRNKEIKNIENDSRDLIKETQRNQTEIREIEPKQTERRETERKERDVRDTKVSHAANIYRNSGTFKPDRETAPNRINNVNNEKHSSRIEESKNNAPTIQDTGFSDLLLKGIERKDGFDDGNLPTDSDGVPITHKTKRVMDAIFKPSKPSLFINVNKDDE